MLRILGLLEAVHRTAVAIEVNRRYQQSAARECNNAYLGEG